MDERKKVHCKLGRLRWYDYAIWLTLWGLLGLDSGCAKLAARRLLSTDPQRLRGCTPQCTST